MTDEDVALVKANIQTAQLYLSMALVWVDTDPSMARIETSSAITSINDANDHLPEYPGASLMEHG